MLRPLLLVVLALLPWVRAQDLLPCPLSDDIAVAVTRAAGQEPLALLRALGGMDLPARAAARAKWDALDARARCALVRSGLRSTDQDVAIGAAAMARLPWLDAAECKRAAAIGRERCLVPDTPFDLVAFADLFDGEDAGRLLAGPIPLPRADYNFVGLLHRWLGPEHVPLLVQLAHSDDRLLREEVFHTLFTGIAPDLAQRDKLGELVLSWPRPSQSTDDPTVTREPFVPRPYELRPAGPGYPPLLAALLDRVFVQDQDGTGCTLAWRWALASTPAENDRALLTRLCAARLDPARQIGVCGLLVLQGDVAGTLRTAAQRTADEDGRLLLAGLLALGALAQRGDQGAARELADFAASSPLALAVRLHFAPDVALRGVIEQVTGTDAKAAAAAIERLAAAVQEADWWGVELADPGPALAEAVAAKDLDAARIGIVMQHFLGARTKALCDQCVHKMTAPESGQLPLPILELHDPQVVTATLREWFAAKATSQEVRDGVARLLLRAGDQTVAGPLWTWVQGLGEADDRHAATLEFGACGGKDVLQLLGGKVPKEPPAQTADAVAPLAGLVAAFAGDTRMASGLLGELMPLSMEDFAAAWRALAGPLLAGDAASAIRGYLAIRPLSRGPLPGLGAFRDVAIPYLMQAREQREHGLYLWATGELALIGMPAARDEVDGAVARRMYRWTDWLDPRVIVGRGSAEGIVKVLPHLPSNCCNYCHLASRLEGAFEVDVWPPDYAFKPRAQMVTERWWSVGERWRWSWLAGKLIAGPK